MTIVDIYKPNKSYKSLQTKYGTKQLNVYLYIQVIKDENKNFLCMKYLVINNQLNYLPTHQIDFREINIINKATVKLNNNVVLNVILVEKLLNPNILRYRFNYSYFKLDDNHFKQFFNVNKLCYKNANITRQIQNFNTNKLEDELLCNLLDNIKI